MRNIKKNKDEIIYLENNVNWLPQPNIIELILDHKEAARELTKTAFAIPLYKDTIVFCQNINRGNDIHIEIPGGHIEKNEAMQEAAIRETYEETGCMIKIIRPFGYLRMRLLDKIPRNYKYPVPISYQQIYLANVEETHKYTVNSECLEPIFITENNFDILDDLQRAIRNATL